MKKVLKDNVLGFIVGAILCTTVIGVYAAILAESVSFSSSETSTTNVQDAIDELYVRQRIRLGDYISLTPTSTNYTIPASETGYTSNQTINPSELNLWRVIQIDSTGIDIVSEYTSSTFVYFGKSEGYITPAISTSSVTAYAKFIKTLNTIAAQYTDNNLVIATRHMGYDGTATEELTDKSKLIKTTASWECSTGDSCAPTEALGGGDLGYLKDYNLVKNVLKTPLTHQVNASSGHVTYWLASRYYSYNSSGPSNIFSGRIIIYNSSSNSFTDISNTGFITVINSKFRPYSNSATLRPILTLKPDATIVSGSGTSDSPYVLG